jgi:hypothetical protein
MTEGLRKEEDEEPFLHRMWTKGEKWVRARREVKSGLLCPAAAPLAVLDEHERQRFRPCR